MPLEAVRIVGDVQVEARGKPAFTAYILSVNSTGARWEVRRRYSAFLALHEHLENAYTEVPPIPWKSPLGSSHPWVVEHRRQGLDTFVSRCATHPDICDDREFLEFVGFRLQLTSPNAIAAVTGVGDEAVLKAEVAELEQQLIRLRTPPKLPKELELDEYALSLQRRLDDSSVWIENSQTAHEAAKAALSAACPIVAANSATAVGAEVEGEAVVAEAFASGLTSAQGSVTDTQTDATDAQPGATGAGAEYASAAPDEAVVPNGKGSDEDSAVDDDEPSVGISHTPNGRHYRQQLLRAASIMAEVKGHVCFLTDAGVSALQKQVRMASRALDRPLQFKKVHAALKLEMLSLPSINPAEMPAGAKWRVNQAQIQQLVSSRPLALLRALQAAAIAYDALGGDHSHVAALGPLAEVAENGVCLRFLALAVSQTSAAKNFAQGVLLGASASVDADGSRHSATSSAIPSPALSQGYARNSPGGSSSTPLTPVGSFSRSDGLAGRSEARAEGRAKVSAGGAATAARQAARAARAAAKADEASKEKSVEAAVAESGEAPAKFEGRDDACASARKSSHRLSSSPVSAPSPASGYTGKSRKAVEIPARRRLTSDKAKIDR